MNRNQRIVVSIVGIIIVTLALIGITYAYFMTKIIGNSSTTSISGTLADLELTYADGNGVIKKDTMMPGDKIEKTFTVENTGSATVSYIVVLEDVTNTLTRKNDLVYTLSCARGCNGVKEETFPISDMPIVSNSIEKDVTQEYVLTVTYKNYDDVDQSIDMGKKFSAKVNIKDEIDVNPYKNEKDSLAYKIINTSLLGTNGTRYRETPLSRPGIDSTDISKERTEETQWNTSFQSDKYYIYSDDYTFDEIKGTYTLINPKIVSGSSAYEVVKGKYIQNRYGGPYANPSNWSTNLYEIYKENGETVITYSIESTDRSAESTLSKMNDDLGVSYYYRGGVEDNYINFAKMCWRIVRVEGDGSTKIVLEDSTQKCENSTSKSNATISEDLDSFFKTKLSSYQSSLKYDTWKKEKYYTLSKEFFINKPLSIAFGNIISSNNAYIGLLNATEVAYAGYTSTSTEYYKSQTNYLNLDVDWFVLATNGAIETGVQNKYLDCQCMSYSCQNRPAVTLNKDVAISGQGTKSDPYVVN